MNSIRVIKNSVRKINWCLFVNVNCLLSNIFSIGFIDIFIFIKLKIFFSLWLLNILCKIVCVIMELIVILKVLNICVNIKIVKLFVCIVINVVFL